MSKVLPRDARHRSARLPSIYASLQRSPRPRRVAMALLLVLMSTSPGKAAKPSDTVTVGMEATAVNSLIYLAEELKYFSENGLDVRLKDRYPSGAAAVQGMLKGEVHLATAAELAIVRHALARQSVHTLATIDMFMHMKLVGRKDRGVVKVADLKGKKIGIPMKSAAEFQFGRFLDLQGLKRSELSIVDVQAPEAVNALTNGLVDAVVTWQPSVMVLEDRLGPKAAIWSVQSGQPMYCVLVASDEVLTKRWDVVRRFLRSLHQAEDYLVRNGAQARRLVQKRLNYDDRYTEKIWPEHQLSLRLDQSLVLAMEDQARWMIENALTNEKQVPNFLDYLREDALKELKPAAVNIIR